MNRHTITKVRTLKRGLLLLALGLPGAALAHEGGHDVRGVVTSVSAQDLTVATRQGSEKFAVTPETAFVKDGKSATAQDVRVSDRVVVHAKKKAGRMEAIKVRFASPKQR